MDVGDRDVTIEEAAKVLGRSERQLRRYVQAGQLPAKLVPLPAQQIREHLMVRLSDVLRLKAQPDDPNV